MAVPPVGLDLVGGRLGARLVDVATDDRGARGREQPRRGFADPAAHAGEHRHLIRQIEQLLHAAHGTPPVYEVGIRRATGHRSWRPFVGPEPTDPQ